MRRRDVLAAAFVEISGDCKMIGHQRGDMFGLISKEYAVPGNGAELIAVLVAGSTDMPDCPSYVVARDGVDDNAMWITEVWKDQTGHDASLAL